MELAVSGAMSLRRYKVNNLPTENQGPLPGDGWCSNCKRWVARRHITAAHSHSECSDEGCGYHCYDQDHPQFVRDGLPKPERARHD